ncbi:hypothetical protein QR680_014310 [Steinernema hermaphroditum]|uniref:Reverse transcriptase domain-containing protein n=1 Tax=Steinernema hermaphroditum TaxID=289476 RepID=A0AA39I8I0_9BILA|nr:hypothetical protein QR680_014310 [Steinernema hermaphroditum]
MKKIDDEEERIAASTLKRENRAAATFPGREEPKHHSSAETAVRTDASSTADEKSYRFAIDFRRVNKITAPEVYLPLISDLIDSVGSKIYFSTFDFTSGFWQLPLAEEDVEKTAFITFMGLFEFLRMPFGLCGAPATFQKAMQEMRREITAAAFIYLDDIVIASNTEEEHVKDVDQFLSVVERYGLKLKLEKCQFARAEVKYLGLLYPAMMPSRANQRAKKPLAPKEDLKLRLAIMEHHLATLIIDPGTLTRPSWGPEPRQEKDHGSGRERWLTRRGWISAISEELRKWAENPPLSAARRQELYEELVKTEGSPIVFGRNDREGLHYLHIVPERATAPEPNYEFGYDDEDDDSDDWERFLEEARRRLRCLGRAERRRAHPSPAGSGTFTKTIDGSPASTLFTFIVSPLDSPHGIPPCVPTAPTLFTSIVPPVDVSIGAPFDFAPGTLLDFAPGAPVELPRRRSLHVPVHRLRRVLFGGGGELSSQAPGRR